MIISTLHIRVLDSLSTEPLTAIKVGSKVERSSGSNIYYPLNYLTDKGFIEIFKEYTTTSPTKVKHYKLTDKGKQLLGLLK